MSFAQTWALLVHSGWIMFQYPVNGMAVTFALRLIIADNRAVPHLLSISMDSEAGSGGMVMSFVELADD